MKITARLMTLGKPNLNGHVYEESTVRAAIDQLDGSWMLGQIGMPKGPAMSVGKASHVVSNLRIVGDDLIADVETMDTESGRMLEAALVNCGVTSCDIVDHPDSPISFRTAGTCTHTQDGDVVIVRDYIISSINAVTDGA